MWKKILLVVFLCLLTGFIFLHGRRQNQEQTTPRVILDLDCRSLQPGEVLRITLRVAEAANYVQFRFQDKKFPAVKQEGDVQFIAFIGLDLGLDPGIYPLHITILYADGRQASKKEEIAVILKEFSVKKLWVDEKFVTPPPEVHERIRRESELLSAIYGMYTPTWMGEGKFIIPSEGEVVPNFGERRIFNNQPRSSHSGIDISSPLGAPVRASNSGSVVVANDLYYSGKTVIIDHGLGVFSLYCHFSKLLVQIGDQVAKGELIGEIGATGRVTGPHLHWGFRVSGSRVDPFSLLNLDWE